jgi:hypothetical protein
MVKLTKEEFRDVMRSFLESININGRIVNLKPTNDEIDYLFDKYYNQVPKLDDYKEAIDIIVADALDDGESITFKDILDRWDDSDDRTTIASNFSTDSIEDYLGGKRKSRRKRIHKSKKRRITNKRRKRIHKSKKRRMTNKRRRQISKSKKRYLKGGKGMTDTIDEEPIAYKEDEYDQMKNDLNYYTDRKEK